VRLEQRAGVRHPCEADGPQVCPHPPRLAPTTTGGEAAMMGAGRMGFARYWTVKRDVDPESLIEAGRKMGEVIRLSNVPLAGLDGTGEPTLDANNGTVWFNGVEDSYEGFVWPPDLVAGRASPDQEDAVFEWCKTRRLPYDAVVAACLRVAREVLGDSIRVEADEE
jgi:hypothetical protein